MSAATVARVPVPRPAGSVYEYPTTHEVIVLPRSLRPAMDEECWEHANAELRWHRCTRRKGHHGRHASVRWRLGGRVRAVWGPKPDTSKARRVTAEEIAARLAGGVQ